MCCRITTHNIHEGLHCSFNKRPWLYCLKKGISFSPLKYPLLSFQLRFSKRIQAHLKILVERNTPSYQIDSKTDIEWLTQGLSLNWPWMLKPSVFLDVVRVSVAEAAVCKGTLWMMNQPIVPKQFTCFQRLYPSVL